MAKKINNKKKDGLSLIEKQNQFKEWLKKIAIKRMGIKFERLKKYNKGEIEKTHQFYRPFKIKNL
jgi:hypothetical protein